MNGNIKGDSNMEEKEKNIYLVKNTKNEHGGQFYNIYKNEGEKLDLTSYLERIDGIDELDYLVYQDDKTFKRAGGLILGKDDKIVSTTVYTPNMGKIEITEEEQNLYDTWQKLDELSNVLYEARKQEMEDFIVSQKRIDEQLKKLLEQKQQISKSIHKTKGKRKSLKKGN